jgi:ribosomal protein L12E/L44/L45/RPP1/RPP2
MLAMLGGDWKKFVTECVAARRDTLDAYAHSTPTNILFDTLLRTNGVRIGPNYTSVMALLAEPDKWGVLNGTSCGAFYNDLKGYLVIDWIAALSNGGVLNRAEPWCREPYHRLKYQLDQHTTAANFQEYGELGVEDFLNACGVSSQPHTVTVLRVGAFVSKLREMNLRRSSVAAAPPASSGEPAASAAAPPATAPAAQGAGAASLPPGMRGRGNNM